MENLAFALLEPLLHYPKYFQSINNLTLTFLIIFLKLLMLSKIENDVMI